MGGAVEDSAGQVAKDAGPAAKRAKEVGHSVADDVAEGADGAAGKAKGAATELKGQARAAGALLLPGALGAGACVSRALPACSIAPPWGRAAHKPAGGAGNL